MKQELENLERMEIERCDPLPPEAQAAYDGAEPGTRLARHGDLMLAKTAIPDSARPVPDREILRSTITGHVHAVIGEAELLRDDDAYYVRVLGVGGIGLHAQHAPGLMPKGTYLVVRKREETASGIQRVAD